jgi:hypothetical protein
MNDSNPSRDANRAEWRNPMHPILITVLADDRRRRCPCGAVAQQRYGLCRECRAVAAWRQETVRTRYRAILGSTRVRTGKARLFVGVASLLHLISGKAEN